MTVTDNQKMVLAEHAAADKAVVDAADVEEWKTLGSLLGRSIIGVEFTKVDEGEYSLTLDDGRVVSFSAQGDDMTFVTMSITIPQSH